MRSGVVSNASSVGALDAKSSDRNPGSHVGSLVSIEQNCKHQLHAKAVRHRRDHQQLLNSGSVFELNQPGLFGEQEHSITPNQYTTDIEPPLAITNSQELSWDEEADLVTLVLVALPLLQASTCVRTAVRSFVSNASKAGDQPSGAAGSFMPVEAPISKKRPGGKTKRKRCSSTSSSKGCRFATTRSSLLRDQRRQH